MTNGISKETSPVRRGGIKLICLVVSTALGSGCVSFHPVPSPTAPTEWSGESFHPGETLRVFTHDGRKLDLLITAVTRDGLVGEPPYTPPGVGKFTIAFSDIARVERAKFDGAKTAGAILVTVLGVLVVFVIIFAATFDLDFQKSMSR